LQETLEMPVDSEENVFCLFVPRRTESTLEIVEVRGELSLTGEIAKALEILSDDQPTKTLD